MKNPDEQAGPQTEEAVEALLAQATPRPAPPTAVKDQAKRIVEAEWRKVAGKRQRRWQFAAAATIAAIAIVATMTMSAPNLPAISVASVDKANGNVSLLGDDGILRDTNDLRLIQTGQMIRTDANSGLGLNWELGGSLRLDAETTVHFVSADEIELRAGRIYFDSQTTAEAEQPLLVHTDYGDVRHLGTQFMVDVRETDMLRVSVREGRVAIAGQYREAKAEAGKQVLLHGNRTPLETSLPRHSREWAWVEAITPAKSMDGKTFRDLLNWVKRETGLNYRFASAAAEDAANKPLSGIEGDKPMAMLAVGARSVELKIQQIDGEIVIDLLGR